MPVTSPGPKRAEAALRRTEQRLAREVAGATTLQAISTRLISESTPQSLYAQILGAAVELMASDAASVQILAADHTSLRLLAWRNFHPDSAAFWQRVAVGAGSTCSKALRDNERVVVADIETCDFMAGTPDQEECPRSGICAVQSTPLRSRTGRPLGMLSTHWHTPHHPTEEDFRFFDVLARQAADLIERTLVEEARRESEERFRLAMNVASGVYTVDLNGLVTYVNPAAETMFGWTGAELIGKKMHDVTNYKHPDGTPFPAVTARVFKSSEQESSSASSRIHSFGRMAVSFRWSSRMLTHPTIDQLHAMHPAAMAQAFDQQRGSPQHASLPFADRFGLLVDAEWTAREQRRLTQRLRNARLRYPASLEDVDFTTPRGLPRDVVLSLGTGARIREHHNVLLTGPARNPHRE